MAKKQIKKTTVKKQKSPLKKKKENKDPIIEYIDGKYGKGKIFKLPEKANEYDPNDFVSSGSLCLNYIISGDYRCGFPRKKNS